MVAADLAGYGASFRPPPAQDHAPARQAGDGRSTWSRRWPRSASTRFAVAGHDRGGRVAYRMALDHPEGCERLAVLDIVPTGEVWRAGRPRLRARLLALGVPRPAGPLPERLIGGDPRGLLRPRTSARAWASGARPALSRRGPGRLPARVRRPRAVEAMCEDYRAGAAVDREPTTPTARRAADRLPGARAVGWRAAALPRFYRDPLELWRAVGRRRPRPRARRLALPASRTPAGDRRRAARLPRRPVAAATPAVARPRSPLMEGSLRPGKQPG